MHSLKMFGILMNFLRPISAFIFKIILLLDALQMLMLFLCTLNYLEA
jgi:hypothetical protein